MEKSILSVQEKYRIEIDTHCHTVASRHAFCTIGETVELARKKGLKGVVIADHHPSLFHVSDDYRIDAPDEAYFSVFCNRFEMIDQDVRVFKSVELNILDSEPWLCETNRSFFSKFDLKLAGVHALRHLFKKSSQQAKNTDAIIQAMLLGDKAPFQILVHPNIGGIPVDFKEIAKVAKERHIAVELNNSTILYTKSSLDSCYALLEALAEQNCLLAVGSDAHVPHEVGLVNDALRILTEVQYPADRIVNRSYEDFLGFLSLHKES